MFDTFIQCYKTFQQEGVKNPELEALRLLDILTNGTVRQTTVSLPTDDSFDLTQLAQQRKNGMPLEYILGKATFMGLALICTPATLIPRQETELLANVALDLARQMEEMAVSPISVVDIGTGCGNLALILANYTEKARILASDISADAITVARQNIHSLNLQDRVTLFCGDMFEPILEAGFCDVDMVVCNPPYIPTASLDKLAPETIDHEPIVALDAGAFGLSIFLKLINEAPLILRPGGALVFEIGEGQENLVLRLLQRNAHYRDILQRLDLAGNVRVFNAVKA